MCDSSDCSPSVSANPDLVCLICNKVCIHKESLRHHIRNVHNLKMTEYWNKYPNIFMVNKNPSTSKLDCKFCGRKFKNNQSLGQHINIAHKISSKDYYNEFLKKDGEGICKECGNPTKFLNINIGYQDFCSAKCVNNNKNVQEKKKITCINNFGVDFPSQSNIIKERRKATTFKNFGVEFPSQSKVIKEKQEETLFKNYGVIVPYKNKEIKKKGETTLFKNYGVYSPLQNEEIKEKQQQTNLVVYGFRTPSQNKEVRDKGTATCLERYGFENYSQTPEYLKYMEATGRIKSPEEKTKKQIYKTNVLRETRPHQKELDKIWDGLCYKNRFPLYTKKEQAELFPGQPINYKILKSLDHKYSIDWCFEHNIPSDVCGMLENLCYVSYSVNSEKQEKTIEQYSQWLKENSEKETNVQLL
jgi:hypothetical protein